MGTTDQASLQQWVAEAGERLDVPGVSVGVLIDGEEHYAFHGVTSIENPLPVDDEHAVPVRVDRQDLTRPPRCMRLVEQGKVDLDAPVRTYLPELQLQDEDVADAASPCCSCSTTPPAGRAT